MAKLFANSGDSDQTPHSAASDLGLHCLPTTLVRVSQLQWVKEPSRKCNKIYINLHHSLGLFSRWQMYIFLTFPQKTRPDILSPLERKWHEMAKPVFLEKSEKHSNMLSAEKFTQSAKCYNYLRQAIRKVFFLFLDRQKHVVGTHYKCLTKELLMNTNNICFQRETLIDCVGV